MATPVKVVESQAAINVSQGHSSPPSANATHIKPKSQGPEIQVAASPPPPTAQQNESLDKGCVAESLPKDDDLYGVSPRQEARDQARRSSQNVDDARAVSEKDTTEQAAARERSHSQPAATAKDVLPTLPDVDNGADEQGKLADASHSQVRVLTQHTSDLDAIKPGFGNSEASTKSRSNFQSGPSRPLSPTSPTSVMAPKRKSATDATPHTSTQSGSGRTLDALRAKAGKAPIEWASLSQTKVQSAADQRRDKPNAESQARTALSAKSTNVGLSAGRGDDSSKTQTTKSNDKASASRTSNTQPTRTDASDLKRPSRRAMMQGEPSEPRDTAAASTSREASKTSRPEDTGENQKRGRGRPKKYSLANNDKRKKPTAMQEEDEPVQDDSYEDPFGYDQADDDHDAGQADAGTQKDETMKDTEHPEEPRPRSKGKGALRSVSKPPSASQGKKRQASQHSEYDLEATPEAEDDSYVPPGGRRKAGKLNQAKSKKASKNSGVAKSAEPTTESAVTSRVTRAQKAAVSSSGPEKEAEQAEVATKHQAQPEAVAAPAESKRSSMNVRQTARTSRPAAEQPNDNREDEDAALDRELQLEPRNSLRRSKAKTPAATPSLEQPQMLQGENTSLKAKGQSQHNAIELLDNDKNSSDDEDVDPGQQTLAIAQTPAAEGWPRQHNSALFRSSPPTRKRYSVEDGQLDLATIQGRKPNIVGWDQHGPRNQGTLIGMTPGTKSAEKNRLSMPLTERSLASMQGPAQGRQGPSSMATSARTGRSTRKTPGESNVAADVADALVGLDKTRNADTPDLINNPDREVLGYEATAHVDEDFNFPMDDMEGDTLVEVNHQSKAASKAAEPRRVRELDRTASQLAMPPPAKEPAAETNTDAHQVRDTAAQSASATETAKNFNATKRSRASNELPERVSKRVKPDERTADGKSTTFEHEAIEVGTKRRLEVEDQTTESAAKRGKTFSETTRTRGADGDPVAGNEKQAGVQRAFASKPEKRRSQDEAPRRRLSQTVDHQGSPVPANMEVHESHTVLETFSQDTKKSPGIADEIQDRSRKSLAESIHAERSRNPDVRSSNAKPQPAAPQADSTVIPRASLRDIEPAKAKFAPQMDPFRGSPKPKDSVVQVTSTPEDSHLSRRAVDNLEPVKRPQHPHTRKARPSPRRSEIPESIQVPVKNNYRDFERLRRAVRSSKPVEEEQGEDSDEDPDKTLVNDDGGDDLPGVEMDEREEEYDSPRSSMALDEDSVVSWCKTLKPHQVDLFDGFVECGRRITHLFAEQENNIARVLHKQHELGLHVIEQDELLRAEDYAQAKEALAKAELVSKQDLEEDLKRMQKLLAERKRETSKRYISSGKKEETWKALEKKLDRLVV